MNTTSSELLCSKYQGLRPGRLKNTSVRTREYLTITEVDSIRKAVRSNRYAVRDELIITLAYRHALRISELLNMRWEQIDWDTETIHIARLKGSKPGVHRLKSDEVRLLKLLKKQSKGFWLFVSERDNRISRSTAHQIIKRAGKKASLPFPIHAHMLRHACGFHLANNSVPLLVIQDYMGHTNIGNTVRYTQLTPNAFAGIEQLF